MDNNSDSMLLRLAEPRKKGILSLVFSRFLLIFLLLLLQVGLYVLFFGWLYKYIPHYYVVQTVFVALMLIYLFSSRMDSTAKLTWMFLIGIFPLPGSFLLLYTQTNLGHRTLKKRAVELIALTDRAIDQPAHVLDELKMDGGAIDDLVFYLNRSGCFPVYKQTEVTYFPVGEKMFSAMLEELKKAEKFIFLEYFIIEEGYMWGKILEILIEKAAKGVEVCVMYDGMCEISTLPPDYNILLEEKGIQARAYSKILPFLSSHYNYRDHRKILVIDGKVAFNGGLNLADEYINRIERFGHWKDTGVMLKGDAVKSFTLMFMQMWCLEKGLPDLSSYLEVDGPDVNAGPSGYVIPYCDCPLDDEKVAEMVYIDILNRAESYVHIMTPYLILDGELETALRFAGQRGVDVKLILPGIPDKKLAYSLAKSHYKSLIKAGVEIYEYTPGFVHSKLFVSDDKKAVVGTINLDYRSLYHHFECAAYLYKTECISEIEEDFQETLARCRRVTPETIKNEKAFYKVAGSILKFAAPLM